MSAAPRLSRLERLLDGELCLSGSRGYDRATTPKNKTAHQEPAAVAVVESAEDVTACVRSASEIGLRVTMQAIGHGAADTRRDDLRLSAEIVNAPPIYRKECKVTTISTEQDVVTLVNVFTVKPENQQRLVDVLVEATETAMNGLPGYVSANIHRSLDGTRVVNYAQWRSREDFEAMLENPEAAPHMQEAAELAEKYEPYLYEVSFVDEVADA